MTAVDAVHRAALLLIECEAERNALAHALARERDVVAAVSKSLDDKIAELKRLTAELYLCNCSNTRHRAELKAARDVNTACAKDTAKAIEHSGMLEVEIQGLLTKNEHLRIERDEARDNLERLRAKEMGTNDKLNKARKRIDFLDAEVDNWVRQVGDKSSEISELETGRSIQDADYADLDNQCEKAREQIEELTASIVAKNGELAGQRERIASLETILTKAAEIERRFTEALDATVAAIPEPEE